MNDPIKLLALFLSGPRVADASMDLEMPTRRKAAEDYFALREAFGVKGWASLENAETAIRAAIGERENAGPEKIDQ